MNDILRIARLKIALQRAFLGRAILRVIQFLYLRTTWERFGQFVTKYSATIGRACACVLWGQYMAISY